MFMEKILGRRDPTKLFLIMVAVLLVICVSALLAVVAFTGKGGESTDDTDANLPAFDDDENGTDSNDSNNEEQKKSYLFSMTDKTKSIASNELNAEHAMLFDPDTLTVIASTGDDTRIYPASMTKIMTMIVAIEALTDLDATFTFEGYIIDALVAQGASRVGFVAGETVTVRDLLYGAALPSGGDATAGLAILVSGSERLFAEKMNEKAAELGLVNTHFVNASGLHHDNHYTTLSEMATIFAYALQNETFAQIMSAKTYTIAATNKHPDGITMYSSLFSRINNVDMPDGLNVICGKTGYTDEAKHCLITLSENKLTGKKYILVTAKGSYTAFLPGGSTDGIYQPIYDLKKVYSNYMLI